VVVELRVGPLRDALGADGMWASCRIRLRLVRSGVSVVEVTITVLRKGEVTAQALPYHGSTRLSKEVWQSRLVGSSVFLLHLYVHEIIAIGPNS
jgi:hypothetical protein